MKTTGTVQIDFRGRRDMNAVELWTRVERTFVLEPWEECIVAPTAEHMEGLAIVRISFLPSVHI